MNIPDNRLLSVVVGEPSVEIVVVRRQYNIVIVWENWHYPVLIPKGEFFVILPTWENRKAPWPEADLRWPTSLQFHSPMCIVSNRDTQILLVRRMPSLVHWQSPHNEDWEARICNIWTIGAMDRTSAPVTFYKSFNVQYISSYSYTLPTSKMKCTVINFPSLLHNTMKETPRRRITITSSS